MKKIFIVLIIVLFFSISLNIYYMNNVNSIIKNAKSLIGKIEELQEECKELENHSIESLSVIYEVYKQDLQTVNINGENHIIIGYDSKKGFNKLLECLKKENKGYSLNIN